MFERIKAFFKKESRVASAIISTTFGQYLWQPKDYSAFAKEGYQSNVYVYSCIDLIAKAAAGIPWLVYQRKNKDLVEIEDLRHPLKKIIERPNPFSGWGQFVQSLCGHLLISGNVYIEQVEANGQPRELYLLRPDRVQVKPGQGFRYTVGGKSVEFTNDEVLHLKYFNPLDDFYGLSPIEVAARSIDQNNESKKWNTALLRNGACPSGVIKTENNLTDEQQRSLREALDRGYTGARNAGRPLLLEGGLSWENIGLSPADMSWIEGLQLTAREIAIVYHVPPELIGDASQKTFSNYREARKSLYTETVLPLLDWLKDELNNWLTPKFGEGFILDYDHDQIEALQEDRQEVWKQALEAVKSGVLTPNEARELLGYDRKEGADVLLAPANLLPLTFGDEE